MIKKILLGALVVAFMATPAFADNRPEFDAVGCDNTNIFNGWAENAVVRNAYDADGVNVNRNSDFGCEWFYGSAADPKVDLCFGSITDPDTGEPYESVLTPHRTSSSYSWDIVLQMQPESDLNVVIRDCVSKRQADSIFTGAEQTGRYTSSSGVLRYYQSMNPRLTVKATGGPHSPWYNQTFCLFARKMPSLYAPYWLDEALFTSKAHWSESIVVVLPDHDGGCDCHGDMQFVLRPGDIIHVTIDVPSTNPTWLRYGEDNVMLQYIGIGANEQIGSSCGSGT